MEAMTPRAEADRAALLPCPFCGEPAMVSMVATVPPAYRCGCTECDCELQTYHEDEAEAIAAWNTRTPSASGWASAIEAAAKVCEDQYAEPQWHPLYRNASCVIAAAIRALPPATAMEDSAMVERVARAIDEVLTNALAPQPEHTNTAAARAALAVIQG